MLRAIHGDLTPPARDGSPDRSEHFADARNGGRAEERIWRWVHVDDPQVERLLLIGSGPLLPPPVAIGDLPARDDAIRAWSEAGWDAGRLTIETWTEAELASLQALLHRALRVDGAHWRERIVQARRWHLEHTQPDNATNRPWAIPAFLCLGSEDSEDAVAEGRLYAETLLHNAMAQCRPAVGQGGGAIHDPLCAAILHDAANLIERGAAIG